MLWINVPKQWRLHFISTFFLLYKWQNQHYTFSFSLHFVGFSTDIKRSFVFVGTYINKWLVNQIVLVDQRNTKQQNKKNTTNIMLMEEKNGNKKKTTKAKHKKHFEEKMKYINFANTRKSSCIDLNLFAVSPHFEITIFFHCAKKIRAQL